MFQLSAFTFGGGFVIISLMRQKFVIELKWISEEEMLDITAIAQSCPGAIAVNASILVGYRIAGKRGVFISVLATILPPLLIISFISSFYQIFQENMYINYVLKGMLACVAAILFDVVLTMFKSMKYILLFIVSFVLIHFFNVNVAFVLLGCGLVGLFL